VLDGCLGDSKRPGHGTNRLAAPNRQNQLTPIRR
jgi:hypothetical protein